MIEVISVMTMVQRVVRLSAFSVVISVRKMLICAKKPWSPIRMPVR